MIATIDAKRIERIGLYVNTGKQSMPAVKKKLGCQYIINGGLFNLSGFTPAGYLTVGGKVLAETANPFGFAIKGNRLVYSYGNNVKADDFIGCAYTPLLRDGRVAVDVQDQTKFGFAHRSAVGVKEDGSVVLLCETVNRSLSGAARDLLDAGCVFAINLDGGDSCKYDFNGETHTSGRIVHNFLCVWTKEEPKGYRKGVDVSEFNGTVDWEAAKAAGVEFAMLRGGYGMTVDKHLDRNAKECNRLGIPVGVYWFSYAMTPERAAQEAAFCLASIKAYKIDLPVAYDYEYASVDYAAKKGMAVTRAGATAFARAFLDAVKSAGYRPMLYSNPDYLSRYFDQSLQTDYPLWLAQYPKSPDPAVPPRECAFWQYSCTGSVAGIGTKVDLDACYADFLPDTGSAREEVRTLAGLADATMEYLDGYRFAEELYQKLSRAMKK